MIVFFLFKNGKAQDNEDCVYFLNLVHHSDEQLCEHLLSTTIFSTYLNNDQSKILIENSPRWKQEADLNINGNGGFGVELRNFIDPVVQVGDSVFIRFTCNETGEQGALADWIKLSIIITQSGD